MRVKAIKNFGYEGRNVEPGEVLELDPEVCEPQAFVDAGLAELAEEAPAKGKAAKKAKEEVPAEPAPEVPAVPLTPEAPPQ